MRAGSWSLALPGGGRGLALTLALAVALVMTAAPAPLASGPRPAVSTYVPPGDVWSAPAPWVDERFTTLPYETIDGQPGTWVLTSEALPLQLTVEQELVDRFGLEAIREALETWNGTDGSEFGIEVAHLSRAGSAARSRDGINRVFLDRTSCGERFLARAHLYPAAVDRLPDSSVAWVDEVDVGICERLAPDRLAPVLRHEVAHIAGLGHLCDLGSECWDPEMSQDNRCRVMSPASYGCQEPAAGDRDGLVYMHPTVPRVRGPGVVARSAAATRVTDPGVQQAETVVAVATATDADLQMAAAAHAASVGAPLVVVDDDCTTGEDGRALNRVARVAAEILLVGPVARGCEDSLRNGWQLTTRRLPDLAAVVDEVLGDTESVPRVIVVPAADDRGFPVSTLAVPIAARTGAPIVPIPADGIDGRAAALLDRADESAIAIVLGGAPIMSLAIEDDLRERGLRIRRLDAPDRNRLAVAVSRMRDIFGPDPISAVLIPADPAAAPAAAAALAGRAGAAILPVTEARHRQVLDPLGTRIDRALLVADEHEASADLQLALSRLVDHD